MFSFFQRMGITRKLFCGFLPPLLTISALLLLSLLMLRQLNQTNNKSQEFLESGIAAKQMQNNIIQVQQWLTDISATRGLDGLDDGFEKAEEHERSFRSHLERFRTLAARDQDSRRLQELAQLEERFSVYYQTGIKMAQAYVAEGPQAGNRMMGSFDQAAEKS